MVEKKLALMKNLSVEDFEKLVKRHTDCSPNKFLECKNWEEHLLMLKTHENNKVWLKDLIEKVHKSHERKQN